MRKYLFSGAAMTALLVSVSACSPTTSGPATSAGSICVDIPESSYFQVVDGRFSPISSVASAIETDGQLAARLLSEIGGNNLQAPGMLIEGSRAVVTGSAPSSASRNASFEVSKSHILADSVARGRVTSVENQITVEDTFNSSAMEADLNRTFSTGGFSWMKANVRGDTVRITGSANSVATRDQAFSFASAGVRAHPDYEGRIEDVLNDIGVVGELTPADLEASYDGKFAEIGYDWMGLDVKGSTGIIYGTAPSEPVRDIAFDRGQALIKLDPDASKIIKVTTNAIEVEGGAAAVGSALLNLSENPSLSECRAAFVETMEARNVEFSTGSAIISSDSARLLDATTAVALLCNTYEIEIGGHTDSRGAALGNLELSQRRADEVRKYLIQRGVRPRILKAVGYGSDRPIDPGNNAAAWEKNRRTEFTVRTR